LVIAGATSSITLVAFDNSSGAGTFPGRTTACRLVSCCGPATAAGVEIRIPPHLGLASSAGILFGPTPGWARANPRARCSMWPGVAFGIRGRLRSLGPRLSRRTPVSSTSRGVVETPWPGRPVGPPSRGPAQVGPPGTATGHHLGSRRQLLPVRRLCQAAGCVVLDVRYGIAPGVATTRRYDQETFHVA
jgi:hypothetical protein